MSFYSSLECQHTSFHIHQCEQWLCREATHIPNIMLKPLTHPESLWTSGYCGQFSIALLTSAAAGKYINPACASLPPDLAHGFGCCRLTKPANPRFMPSCELTGVVSQSVLSYHKLVLRYASAGYELISLPQSPELRHMYVKWFYSMTWAVMGYSQSWILHSAAGTASKQESSPVALSDLLLLAELTTPD